MNQALPPDLVLVDKVGRHAHRYGQLPFLIGAALLYVVVPRAR